MKKSILLFGLIAGMALSSCTEDEVVFTGETPLTPEPYVAESQIRTVEDALQIVSENYPSIYNQPISRSFCLDPSNVLVVGYYKYIVQYFTMNKK